MRIVTGALVIRHADYGDSNRMVTLITPKYGKIEAVARGCRRLKSPIVNAAELFTSGEYTLFERNGRYSIEQCQISESFFALRQDYDRLVHGVYWLRLLDALVQPDLPAEMIRSEFGVGWVITAGNNSYNMAQVLVGIIAIGIIGLVLANALRALERRLCAWKEG